MQPETIKLIVLALKLVVQGPVFLPGDEHYAAEIAAYNTAVSHLPDIVLGAVCSQDIAEAVRLAQQYGLPVSVQATGHGAMESINSGLLISTRRMNQIAIDAENCTAAISAGVQWKSVLAEAAKYDLAPIPGSASDVGVVGYLLGGGVGPLARSHGFSSDYLVGLTVVTNAGKVINASETEHPDLFWALRGGKIGFGIITEVCIRLVKMKTLYAGSLFFEEKDIETVLRSWISWSKQIDPLVTTSIAIVRFPPIPAIPEKFRGRRLLSLRFAFPGSIEEGIRLASPLRACAPVYFDDLGELPAPQMGRIHNDPTNPMAYWASTVLLKHMDQDFAEIVLKEFGPGKESPIGVLEIRHIGGATHKDVEAGSSVGGRSAEYVFSLVGKDPKQFEHLYTARSDELFHNLRLWICEENNINLMGSAVPGKHFKYIWPPAIMERLQAVQRRYK